MALTENKQTPQYECNKCGLIATNMSKCGRCRVTYYCTKDCQTSDWKKHKILCKQEAKNLDRLRNVQVHTGSQFTTLEHRQSHQNAIAQSVMNNSGLSNQNELPMFCVICGDTTKLQRVAGNIICSDCIEIQLNM